MSELNIVRAKKVLYIMSLILIFFSLNSFGATKREAIVVVNNETGRDILSVSVGHKYSNVYKNTLERSTLLKNGSRNSVGIVQYNTGAFTTGKDWWLVTWSYVDDDKVYYSNPNNFRGFIDGLEQIGTVAIPIALTAITATIGAVCTGVTAGVCAPAAIARIGIASASVEVVTAKMMNDEATKGFKQHILRRKDENKKVTITLKRNNVIVISSPSGVSKTVYSSRKPSVTDAERKKLIRIANQKWLLR